MPVRGIRGAITVENNTKEEIIEETKLLLKEMIEKNKIEKEDVCSIFFSVTTDLTAEFPALAARHSGFTHTPLLCLTEIPVPESLEKVVRILIHHNTTIPQKDMIHIYMKKAVKLRPDLSSED